MATMHTSFNLLNIGILLISIRDFCIGGGIGHCLGLSVIFVNENEKRSLGTTDVQFVKSPSLRISSFEGWRSGVFFLVLVVGFYRASRKVGGYGIDCLALELIYLQGYDLF